MKVLKVNLDRNVIVGISLPMNTSNVFPTTLSSREQIKSNILNFVLTNKGERLFRPDFGTNIRKSLFEPNINLHVLQDSVYSDINKQFSNQIELENVTIDSEFNSEIIKILIQYTLKSEFESDLINLTII
jgi:hypothetical protein